MNILEQYHALALEFQGLKNRVRNLIDSAHWPSDCEWKESILRKTLRSSMPQDLQIGRGFVSTANDVSRQIDVLITPTSTPSLFRDGDFNIVSPEGFLGALEVKTKANAENFREGVDALAFLARLVSSKLPRTHQTNRERQRFYGFFAYESEVGLDTALEALQSSALGDARFALDFVCLGASRFILWSPAAYGPNPRVDEWRAYEFEDDRAVGYFLYNVIAATHPCVTQEPRGIWFPEDGKENYFARSIPLRP